MGPISSVDIGSARSPYNLGQIPDDPSGAARGSAPAGGVPGNSSAIMNVGPAVSQLLQSIGGGAENDKTLRMLIVLMILLALLDNSQANDASTGNALNQLANSGSGRSQFFGIFSSSTTIEIHQTSTTIVGSTMDNVASVSSSEQPTQGGQVDLSA